MKSKDDQLLALLKQLKSHANIAIIYSGNPSDSNNVLFRTSNPRGWKSYIAVAQDICDALVRSGFKNVHLIPENRNLSVNLAKLAIDFAWCNTAGVQGFDSACHAVALLESLGIPYVGHKPANAAVLDNKHLFKHMLKSQGIATADYITWHPRDCGNVSESPYFEDFVSRTLAETQLSSELPRYVVKPICGRASRNIFIAYSEKQLPQLCQQVYSITGNTVLIEQFLPGREYCVAVMGEILCEYETDGRLFLRRHQSPICFAQFERRLEGAEAIFASMDIKPISSDSVVRLDSASSSVIIGELNDLACKIFRSQGLYSLIRIDLRMDSRGKLHVLEANQKPDLKASDQYSTSLFAMGLEQLQVDYDTMILSQVINTLDELCSYRTCFSERFAKL